MVENRILTKKHILLILGTVNHPIQTNFCGVVYNQSQQDQIRALKKGANLYLAGDISLYDRHIHQPFIIIKDISYNYPETDILIDIGKVPINILNKGILIPKLFDDEHIFSKVQSEHNFQDLSISNKPGKSFRKGIYLSNIQKDSNNLHFNILRCSTNLSGPTDNFRETDNFIVSTVNNIQKDYFKEDTNLNHVLSQIYEHTTNKTTKTIKSAGIALHSDKTKDMPRSGLIAFCTFYKPFNKEIKKSGEYNYEYKGQEVLTKLHFKPKNEFNPEFTITLYPNSVFIIPLSTNREYQYEIKGCPSIPFEHVPVRMGYVIRSSNKEAIHINGENYIKEGDNITKMIPLSNEDRERLRSLYYEENSTTNIVEYSNFYSSMNQGDYLRPII